MYNIIKKYYAALTGTAVFIVYIITLAPSVLQIDSGELAAVQITLGIAHPTGYPLFTLLGYLFSRIPLPMTSIMQANLLAAIYCSVSVVIFTITLKFVLDNPDQQTSKGNSDKNKSKKLIAPQTLPDVVKIILSVFGSLTLAFSRTFWMQSTSVEVYSLHILLISIIVYFLLKIILGSESRTKRDWIIIGILFGLAFSNHMTTLLLIPGAVYVLYLTFKSGKYRVKNLIAPALGFLSTLVVIYSYLPLRASAEPLLNWGNPVNFINFFRHVSGAQYRVWLFSSFEAAQKQFVNFLATLPDEFTYPILILSILGLISFKKHNIKLFLFFLISFVFTVLYSSNYDIKDLDTYYLLAYISISVFAVIGAWKLWEIFIERKNLPGFVFSGLLIIVCSFEIYSNFSSTNQSDDYTFEDYTKAVINSTAENSIILSYQWDYFISASYYFQHCENYRADVEIIDKELLRRSWYYDQLRNNYGNIFKGLEKDVDGFLTALKPFEENKQFDSNKLEHFYQAIMTNLVRFNFDEHPVYIGPELVENEMRNNQFRLPEGYALVPDLFLFRIVKRNDYTPAKLPDYKLRIPPYPNEYHKFIENISVKMLIYRAMYELSYNKPERARIYAQKVLSDFPEYKLPNDLKKKLSL